MRKRWLTLAVLVIVTVLLASVVAAVRGSAASAAHKASFSACLVTDIGGLNDKSFNHLAYVGLLRAEKTGVKGRVIQSQSSNQYIPNLQTCAQSGAGITIGVGFLMTDAMDAVATSFPKSKFAIVDVDVSTLKHKPKNVEGLLFREQQAGYLVGYAAGLWTKQHGGAAVGSVGGIKIPPVDRYIAGFQYGAKKADPGIKTLNAYSQSFTAQAKCKEAALNQIAAGSDVEFQVAGSCGLGVLDAAHSKNIFGVGVDADQGYLGAVGDDERAEEGGRRRLQRDQERAGGHDQDGHQQAVRRRHRRCRLRQVELEGAGEDPGRCRSAVRAAEGGQDLGHPVDRQVAKSASDWYGAATAAP